MLRLEQGLRSVEKGLLCNSLINESFKSCKFHAISLSVFLIFILLVNLMPALRSNLPMSELPIKDAAVHMPP